MILDVGMVVYATHNHSSFLSKYTIARVTPKQAIIEYRNKSASYDIKFDRDIGDRSFFYAKGASGYDRISYQLETNELQNLYYRQNLERKFGHIDVKNLCIEELEAILDIANNNKEGVK